MTGVGWILTIILGGLAGWIAEKIMKADMGLIANIIVGVLGAVILNAILALIGWTPAIGSGIGWLIWQCIVAIVGACILIWIYRAVRGRS